VGDVLAQQRVAVDLVAVDDGSRDGSANRLKEWSARDGRLRVLLTPGVGPGRALDLALGAARHDRVAQMEADDRCPPDRLARLNEALEQNPKWDAVTSRAGQIGHRSAGMRRYLEWQNSLLSPAAQAAGRFIEIPSLHQTGLYRRDALDAIGGFSGDPRWPLDIDFWMRWHQSGRLVGKVARVLYRWRQHPLQSTRTSPLHRIEALRRCKAHYFVGGPGRAAPLQLLSVGRTLSCWSDALRDAGRPDHQASEWRPGTPLPAAVPGAIRVFAFGTAPARDRIRRQEGAFDPARDWFVA
jgi:glycosyltransferase involved in cell wall biosynthesis